MLLWLILNVSMRWTWYAKKLVPVVHVHKYDDDKYDQVLDSISIQKAMRKCIFPKSGITVNNWEQIGLSDIGVSLLMTKLSVIAVLIIYFFFMIYSNFSKFKFEVWANIPPLKQCQTLITMS